MGDDDFALDAEGDEASAGWCFGVSSMCAVLGSTGSLLLDSARNEHLCSPKFADFRQKSSQAQRCAAERSDNFQVRKLVPLLVGPSGGKHAMEAAVTFRVAEVRDHILSLGKLVRKGFHFTLGPPWLHNGERREERAALLGTKQLAC